MHLTHKSITIKVTANTCAYNAEQDIDYFAGVGFNW